MKIRKLFARRITKREIYKRLCRFIDENYEGLSGWGKADTPAQRPASNVEPLEKIKPEPERRYSLAVEPEEKSEEPCAEGTAVPGPRYSAGASSRKRDFASRPTVSCVEDGDFQDIFRIYNKRAEQPKSRVEKVEKLVAAAEKKDKFSASMMHIIAAKGLTDAQVYNNVFMDRRLFNKIRNNPDYQPSKRTAILIAVSLKLTYEETQSLLETAGYTLTHSNKFDLIVEFFIREGNYDVFEINEMLEHFRQPLLTKCE